MHETKFLNKILSNEISQKSFIRVRNFVLVNDEAEKREEFWGGIL